MHQLPPHDLEVIQLVNENFGFPSTYLVLDTETSGFSFDNDVCVDLGWAVVKNNRVVHHEHLLLDWSRVPSVDHNFIQSQLQKQAEAYAKENRPHYYSWERLCREGTDPLEAIHAYSTLIYDHITCGDSAIVGHGLWRFDRNMIDSHTQKFLDGYTLPWQPNSIIDTGLIEKASQTHQFPYRNESLEQWQERVNNKFARVKWNLGNYCAAKYNLQPNDADMALLHTAAFDCILIQRLVEVYRRIATGAW